MNMMKQCLLVLLTVSLPSIAANEINLPKDYKDTYTEYLSLDRTQSPDQFIRLYANDIALKGRDKNGQFDQGAKIIAEIYSVKKDEKGTVIKSQLNRRIADKLKLIAVMEKQDGFAENSGSAIKTGDWDFAAFKTNGDMAKKNLDSCRGCHTPLTNTDFLFSAEHLPQR